MSDSPWASPVVLVTKKDGSMCFCVDYRRLNVCTVKDVYPLPHIDDSLWLLGSQQWFSKMDLASGYGQVAMSPDVSRKAVFVTHEGLFQFRVMPFGLCNGNIREAHGPGPVRYVWCILISFGTNAPEAMARLSEVLEHLSSFVLQLKAKKYTFMQTKVVFRAYCGPTVWPVTQRYYRQSGHDIHRTRLNRCANSLVS